MMRVTFMGLIAMVLFGCATTPRQPPPPPLTQAEVISMVKAGLTEEDIMRRIDATRTVFRLSSEDVIRLRNEGVSDRLVNFMLDTYTRAAMAAQRRQDAYYYDQFYFNYGFAYGHPWHHW
jgi:hypothetical protein